MDDTENRENAESMGNMVDKNKNMPATETDMYAGGRKRIADDNGNNGNNENGVSKEKNSSMAREKSCGAIVIWRDAETGEDYILMIRHRQGGYRSFPKGHMEIGESERQTAVREVLEETSVRIRIRSSFRFRICYSPAPGVIKDVIYFLARTDNPEVHPHEGEIAEVEWVPVRGAEHKLCHANDRAVLRAALRVFYRENRGRK